MDKKISFKQMIKNIKKSKKSNKEKKEIYQEKLKKSLGGGSFCKVEII